MRFRFVLSLFLKRIVTFWALAGGVVLLAVVLVNGAATMGAAIGFPLAGDVELTEMGVAVAVFMFLPYCQMMGVHVVAEIFSARFPNWLLKILNRIWSIFAALLAAILLWRMSYGMFDYFQYGYTTSILQLPHWMAYLPIIFSLALWFLSTLFSIADDDEITS